MSSSGLWGYWGIVVSLLAMLTVFFVCIGLLYRMPSTTVTGKTESPEEDTEKVATTTKHAA